MTHDSTILTRYAPLRRGFDGDLVDPRAWLTAAEQAELARFRDPVRRRQWLAGRWVGKQLVGEAYGPAEMSRVQILTRDRRGLGSRPQVHIGARLLDRSLSLAHTERGVLAALATTNQLSVGVDLTGRVPCDGRFQNLWFTTDERRWVEADPWRAAIVWSIKEAAYKACQTGQGWSPRLVEVSRSAGDQFACTFDGQAVDNLQLSVCDIDSQIATVACVPSRSGEAQIVSALPLEVIHSPELSFASCL